MSAALLRQKQETAIVGVLGADGIQSITVKPCPACKLPLEDEIFERMHDATSVTAKQCDAPTPSDPDPDMFSICCRCGSLFRLRLEGRAEALSATEFAALDPEVRAHLLRLKNDVADVLRQHGITPLWETWQAEEAAPCS